MATILDRPFTKAPPFTPTFDFFDFVAGFGYKNFYLAVLSTSAGAQHIITTDVNLGSDNAFARYGANATLNQDFDITFNNAATIAEADGVISFAVSCENTKTFDLTATIYHVNSAGTETQIGTVIARQTSGSVKELRSSKFAFTKKQFAKGDKLRVTLDTISNGANTRTFLDPQGRETLVETVIGATIPTRFLLSVPFEIDI